MTDKGFEDWAAAMEEAEGRKKKASGNSSAAEFKEAARPADEAEKTKDKTTGVDDWREVFRDRPGMAGL